MVGPSNTPSPLARNLSGAEYARMVDLGFFANERVELIRGIVVRMDPVGPSHADVVDRLGELLVLALAGRARVRIQQPMIATSDSQPQPDVAVVAPNGDYARQHPLGAMLVIEVASSSLEHDCETKAALYAASNVEEYWVVDVEDRAILVFGSAKDGVYVGVTRRGHGEGARPASFPDVVVAVDVLFG